MHVFGGRSALAPDRVYTPEDASLTDYQTAVGPFGVTHTVVVQPSIYGVDNHTTLEAVKADPARMRAVVAVDPAVTDEALAGFHAGGARGVRINPLFNAGMSVDAVIALSERLAPLGWHILLLADLNAYPEAEDLIEGCAVPLIFDHCGHINAGDGLASRGFGLMKAALVDGRAFAKLSGPYRQSNSGAAPYYDVIGMSVNLLKAAPQRCIWGTDWPHPALQTKRPSIAELIAHFDSLGIDQIMRRQVLWQNAAKLYGFEG